MKNHQKKTFFMACAAYLLVTLLDLLFTYIATPNLYLEGNVLFGNWPGLIIINVITYAAYVGLAYYGFVKYKSPVTDQTDLKHYLAYINYGDADKYVPMMWKFPKHWGPQIACLCWSICVVLPFCRLIIVLEWFLMILNIEAPLFFTIVSVFPAGRIDLFLAVILAWVLSFVWIKREFKENLLEIEQRKQREQE